MTANAAGTGKPGTLRFRVWDGAPQSWLEVGLFSGPVRIVGGSLRDASGGTPPFLDLVLCFLSVSLHSPGLEPWVLLWALSEKLGANGKNIAPFCKEKIFFSQQQF